MSMIIGRKQIILAALVVALGAAIVLNWRFGSPISLAGAFGNNTLGAASYVDNQKVSAGSTNSYFATARLNREQNRAQAEEVLKTTISNASATTAEKQSAEAAIESIAKNITSEGDVESLIKAKGFGDCMCFIDDGAVQVVVKAKTGDTLTASDAAQIYDIVTGKTKIAVGNIKIIQAK